MFREYQITGTHLKNFTNYQPDATREAEASAKNFRDRNCLTKWYYQQGLCHTLAKGKLREAIFDTFLLEYPMLSIDYA